MAILLKIVKHGFVIGMPIIRISLSLAEVAGAITWCRLSEGGSEEQPVALLKVVSKRPTDMMLMQGLAFTAIVDAGNGVEARIGFAAADVSYLPNTIDPKAIAHSITLVPTPSEGAANKSAFDQLVRDKVFTGGWARNILRLGIEADEGGIIFTNTLSNDSYDPMPPILAKEVLGAINAFEEKEDTDVEIELDDRSLVEGIINDL